MTNQPFAVLGLPSYVTDRGSRPPLAGFIGYELLARFAARLDYENKDRQEASDDRSSPVRSRGSAAKGSPIP